MKTSQTGRRGEDICAAWYEAHGYTVLARNFHTRRGEVDLIVRDEKCIVFAEVKTRSSLKNGLPCEAVDAVKQRKIILVAMEYLSKHSFEKQPRFDVFEVWLETGMHPRVRCLQAAFDASALDGEGYF